ncbi:TPA: hypothetical protein DIC40_07740 [Patescibacteria group bacterium]|nr:hypothetical protein [Candidatus Gracilibacteria bacterium]
MSNLANIINVAKSIIASNENGNQIIVIAKSIAMKGSAAYVKKPTPNDSRGSLLSVSRDDLIRFCPIKSRISPNIKRNANLAQTKPLKIPKNSFLLLKCTCLNVTFPETICSSPVFCLADS